MAQLARHAEIAVQHLAAGDNAAADAGAKREQHQIVDIAPRAHPFFAQRRGVGVVLQNHGACPAAVRSHRAGIVFELRQIVRADNQPLFEIG